MFFIARNLVLFCAHKNGNKFNFVSPFPFSIHSNARGLPTTTVGHPGWVPPTGFRISPTPSGRRRPQRPQRWANNSVFEYYLNTWGQILVFVFGWLFETEYYSYSGNFLIPNIIRIRIQVIFQTKYYSYLYSGTFLAHSCTRFPCYLGMEINAKTQWTTTKNVELDN